MRQYRAYGMDLESGLALAGMRPAAWAGDRRLRLERVDAAELEARWSGAARPAPLWLRTFRHGVQLGRDGDVLFTCDDGARHLLSPACDVLRSCRLAGLSWQRDLLESVLPAVAILRGFDALRASAVRLPAGTVAFAAAGGDDLAALLAGLLARGHDLVAQGTLVLDRGRDGIAAHPGPPHVRLPLDGARELAPRAIGHTVAAFGCDAWVVAHRLACAATPLAGICLVGRESAARPSLAAHVLCSGGSRGRDRIAAELARRVAVVRLAADPAAPAEALAALVEKSFTPEAVEVAA